MYRKPNLGGIEVFYMRYGRVSMCAILEGLGNQIYEVWEMYGNHRGLMGVIVCRHSEMEPL